MRRMALALPCRRRRRREGLMRFHVDGGIDGGVQVCDGTKLCAASHCRVFVGNDV